MDTVTLGKPSATQVQEIFGHVLDLSLEGHDSSSDAIHSDPKLFEATEDIGAAKSPKGDPGVDDGTATKRHLEGWRLMTVQFW